MSIRVCGFNNMQLSHSPERSSARAMARRKNSPRKMVSHPFTCPNWNVSSMGKDRHRASSRLRVAEPPTPLQNQTRYPSVMTTLTAVQTTKPRSGGSKSSGPRSATKPGRYGVGIVAHCSSCSGEAKAWTSGS